MNHIKTIILLVVLVSCSDPVQERVQNAVEEIKRHCKAVAGENTKIEILASTSRILYRCGEDYSQGVLDVETLPVIFVP